MRTVARLAMPVIALFAMAGVMAPIAGMALDHHFAERSPSHSHIFLSGQAVTHVHYFNAPHIHDEAPAEPGAFAVMDNDRHSSPALTIIGPVEQTTLQSGIDTPEGAVLLAGARPVAVLRGLTVPPPVPPPLA